MYTEQKTLPCVVMFEASELWAVKHQGHGAPGRGPPPLRSVDILSQVVWKADVCALDNLNGGICFFNVKRENVWSGADGKQPRREPSPRNSLRNSPRNSQYRREQTQSPHQLQSGTSDLFFHILGIDSKILKNNINLKKFIHSSMWAAGAETSHPSSCSRTHLHTFMLKQSD